MVVLWPANLNDTTTCNPHIRGANIPLQVMPSHTNVPRVLKTDDDGRAPYWATIALIECNNNENIFSLEASRWITQA